ncbi:MAG: fluoride efflux transporter CrcB [Gemmatimonadaceae bacterium]|nr:fluoride efflux transporter CrcB [Gemmatimonadaceae bacterium]
MVLLYVALGGAVGSVLRYIIGGAVQRATHAGFPYGTLAVNVLGCFLIGFLIKTYMNAEPSSPTRALLVVGFCGGFTTFSAFSSETLGLFEGGAYARAALYVGASLLLCLGATAGGLMVAGSAGQLVGGR